jgi:hypothetical protein
MSTSQPGRSADGPQRESDGGLSWDARVAREVRHQEVIEACFDRAEAYGRLRDFVHAVDWLDRASELSGGLPPTYRARRELWARAAAVQALPRLRTRVGQSRLGRAP